MKIFYILFLSALISGCAGELIPDTCDPEKPGKVQGFMDAAVPPQRRPMPAMENAGGNVSGNVARCWYNGVASTYPPQRMAPPPGGPMHGVPQGAGGGVVIDIGPGGAPGPHAGPGMGPAGARRPLDFVPYRPDPYTRSRSRGGY